MLESIAADSPVKGVDLERFELKHTLLGYVHVLRSDVAFVRVWNHKKSGSESTIQYDPYFLNERGINSEGQSLRISTFLDKETKGILQVTEPIGSKYPIGWIEVRPDFDYSKLHEA